MKYMLRFIFSIVFLLIGVKAFSQENTADTIVPPAKLQRYGVRIGADLYKLARTFYDDNYQGFEIVGDYRISKKLYVAAEVGNEKITVDDTQVNFTTNGSYIKAGFDFNAYENWLDMENMIFVGFRYGFSNFSQNLNSYKIYDNSGGYNPDLEEDIAYFDEVTIYPNREYTGLTAHWVEVIGGVKAEIINNLYMGFSVRLNFLLTESKPDNFDNLYIPGFNRTYNGTFGAGFNYTLSYFIPIYKTGNKK